MLLGLILLLLVFLLIDLVVWGILPLFSGAPYVPTTRRRLTRIVRLADVKAGDASIDIGSGDGRLAIALARAGAAAEGIEINPPLVWYSRFNAWAKGVSRHVRFKRGNLWKQNYAPFRVVTVYGIPYIMEKLERKLRQELKPGAKVISVGFKFPHWAPKESRDGIHLYVQS